MSHLLQGVVECACCASGYHDLASTEVVEVLSEVRERDGSVVIQYKCKNLIDELAIQTSQLHSYESIRFEMVENLLKLWDFTGHIEGVYMSLVEKFYEAHIDVEHHLILAAVAGQLSTWFEKPEKIGDRVREWLLGDAWKEDHEAAGRVFDFLVITAPAKIVFEEYRWLMEEA